MRKLFEKTVGTGSSKRTLTIQTDGIDPDTYWLGVDSDFAPAQGIPLDADTLRAIGDVPNQPAAAA